MPFDDMSIRTEPAEAIIEQPIGNTLQAIGIQPVPRTVAEAHKTQMMADFAAKGNYQAILVRARRAYWVTRQFGEATNVELRRLLASPTISSSPDRSAAPKQIVDVAEKVNTGIKDAVFAVEYFYDDPILNVSYRDANNVFHNDCLGIWDRGNVVAIADVSQHQSKHRFGSLEAVLVVMTIASVMIGLLST